MGSEVFYWVLNMSIVATFTGGLIAVIRKIKIFPKYMICLFWAVPLVRFCVPFGFSSEYSLLNFFTSRQIIRLVEWQGMPDRYTYLNSVQAAEAYMPMQYKTDFIESVFSAAFIVWITIAVLLLLCVSILYVCNKREAGKAVHMKDNIYRSETVAFPAVYGIITPKIIIPAAMARGDISYIIMHEQAHIKRLDNLFRMVALVTACVHWFNPFAWLFLKLYFTDMELACDSKVIKNLPDGQVTEYARAVLYCGAGRPVLASAFGGAKTKVRIESILSYKKMTVTATVCLLLLFGAVAFILLTNGQ